MVKKVIYIEKEKFLRQMIETALKSKGAEIYTAETLTDNHYLIEDIRPDILILDLESSPIDELTNFIKGYSQKIVLTHSADLTLPAEIQAKIAHFMKKPLIANQIATRLLEL